MEIINIEVDFLVVGGGTAGCMAAVKAKQKSPDSSVLVLEKANIRRSGAIAMGMDGVNTAVIPGNSTPEQYVREITIANDGILDQSAVHKTGLLGFDVIQELEEWGVKFQKDNEGKYDLKQVHRVGKYVLPMPEGKDLKKILSRQVKRNKIKVIMKSPGLDQSKNHEQPWPGAQRRKKIMMNSLGLDQSKNHEQPWPGTK